VTPATWRESGRSRDVTDDFLLPADTGAGGLPEPDTLKNTTAT